MPYSYLVSNNGNVTLTGVTVTDNNIDTPPGVSCPQTTLAVGASMTCTAQHTVTQAEIDSNGGGDGDLDNTVTADSNETGADTDDLEIPISRTPALNVVKSSTTTSITAAGQVVPYSYLVSNNGNVTLTGVTVTDNNIDTPPGVSCPQTTLAVGASMTCTAQHTVTQAEIDSNGGGDGDLDNTVTADSNETGADTDDLEIPISRTPALNVVKSSTTTSITAAGQVVPYSYPGLEQRQRDADRGDGDGQQHRHAAGGELSADDAGCWRVDDVHGAAHGHAGGDRQQRWRRRRPRQHGHRGLERDRG